MNNYSISNTFIYSNKSFAIKLADKGLTPLRIASNQCPISLTGKKKQTDHKTYHIAIRLLAGLAVCLTFPITLICLTIKWWKKEEVQQAILRNNHQNQDTPPIVVDEIDEIEDEEELSFDEEEEDSAKDKFKKIIQQEMSLIQSLDRKLPSPQPDSWREYGEAHGEVNQTFDNHLNSHRKSSWPDKRPLYIQRLGTFNDEDLKIISIVSDYLQIFHNLPIQLCKTILTMDQMKEKLLVLSQQNLKKTCRTNKEKEQQDNIKNWYDLLMRRMKANFPRANGQYEGDIALNLMKETLIPELKKNPQEKIQMIAFTSEDLFTQDLSNFVFGCGSLTEGVGIWSKARFGNPSSSLQNFQACLLRMMKISAHEFGHMRGLPHCTDYDCNIGGYMSLQELDKRPLLYCVQDTAKICYLTQTTMLNYHKKVLHFFKNFNSTYQLNCDFSKEIKILNKRISVLEKSKVSKTD